MPQGSKEAYTDKQKRQAQHIESGYRHRGVPRKEAESRAWATVNKESGGGRKSGSGRASSPSSESSSSKPQRERSASYAERSKAAKKGWETRRRNARRGSSH